jgi:hypothetical protein
MDKHLYRIRSVDLHHGKTQNASAKQRELCHFIRIRTMQSKGQERTCFSGTMAWHDSVVPGDRLGARELRSFRLHIHSRWKSTRCGITADNGAGLLLKEVVRAMPQSSNRPVGMQLPVLD